MAFCSKCGSEIKEGNAFCQNCGNAVTGANVSDINTPIKKQSNNKLIGLIAGIVAVVIVIVGAIAIFGGDKPEEVAIKYAQASISKDYNELLKYSVMDTEKFLDDYMDYFCEEEDTTRKELFEEAEESINEVLEEYDKEMNIKNFKDIYKAYKIILENKLEDEYGDYEIEIDVDDIEKLTRSELKDVIEDYKDSIPYDLEPDDYLNTKKIKEGYTVTIEATIDGEDDSDTDKMEFTIVKYKGKYKVLEDISIFISAVY